MGIEKSYQPSLMERKKAEEIVASNKRMRETGMGDYEGEPKEFNEKEMELWKNKLESWKQELEKPGVKESLNQAINFYGERLREVSEELGVKLKAVEEERGMYWKIEGLAGKDLEGNWPEFGSSGGDPRFSNTTFLDGSRIERLERAKEHLEETIMKLKLLLAGEVEPPYKGPHGGL